MIGVCKDSRGTNGCFYEVYEKITNRWYFRIVKPTAIAARAAAIELAKNTGKQYIGVITRAEIKKSHNAE